MARPSTYTQEIADKICEEIVEGKSLRTICRDESIPSVATIFNWLRQYPEFLEQYARAKEEQADTNAEDLQEIVEQVRAGKIDPASARVAADILKWSSSKLKPKKYGDKLDLSGETTVTHKYEELDDDQLEAAIKARKDRLSEDA